MGYGIVGFGAYVPRLRLDRAAIAAAHKWMNPALRGAAKGARAFCSWDEDALTMAVEAARDCLAGHDRAAVGSVRLASTTLPYADLSCGSILASALDLADDIAVENVGGSQRAATSALLAALKAGTDGALVVAGEPPWITQGSGEHTGGGKVKSGRTLVWDLNVFRALILVPRRSLLCGTQHAILGESCARERSEPQPRCEVGNFASIYSRR
ncbi:hypothetical protein J4558_10620 [Leptolyngbya sp. 15MV]|nr:hypothetical protein J4558_10620 [Leptolyngbya sp. 15MV]